MRCIHKGLSVAEELRQQKPEHCHVLTSRSWASIVHDHMEFEARIVFGAAGPGVAVYTETGFLIVDFYERYFLRFKKLRHNLSPCNIETDQQRAFDSQNLFRGPVTLVTAGYRLNDLGLYEDAHIVCWAWGERQWSLRLPDGKQGERSTITVSPNTDQPPIVIARKSMAK
jgi:hypothetical protein